MNKFYHGDCLFVMEHDIAPESVVFFISRGKIRKESVPHVKKSQT